jgi:hypothetical protein
VTEDGWGSLREALAADVRRVSDRLRGLSVARLAGPVTPSAHGWPDYGSAARGARAVAQELADAAGALEAAADGVPYERRVLPVLSDLAAGEQVAVTGHDLLAALDLSAPDPPLRQAVEHAVAALADLRRRL